MTRADGAAVDTEADAVLALRAAGCVFAEDEAALIFAQATSPDEARGMVDRRVAGEPLEVILGWAAFHGQRVIIRPGVFVPRRRTEFLVDQAIAIARPGSVVVDLCCGSGALGLGVATAVPGVSLTAADIETAAVDCARLNLAGIGAIVEGDLFDPLPADLRGAIDILLVNAPYVPSGEIERMPPEARLHEPRVALDGGDDGLDIHRRVAAAARDWLAPGGVLLIETSESQAEAAEALFASHRLVSGTRYSEDYDATVVTGTRPA